MNMPKRRRLTIDISEEEYQVITTVLPAGSRQSFFSPVIEDLCTLLKKRPREIVGAIISRRVKIWDISPGLETGNE